MKKSKTLVKKALEKVLERQVAKPATKDNPGAAQQFDALGSKYYLRQGRQSLRSWLRERYTQPFDKLVAAAREAGYYPGLRPEEFRKKVEEYNKHVAWEMTKQGKTKVTEFGSEPKREEPKKLLKKPSESKASPSQSATPVTQQESKQTAPITKGAATKKTEKKPKERFLYERIRSWLEDEKDCPYTRVVSEVAKRPRTRLAAVPDVIGVRCLPAHGVDELRVVAVEVKREFPSSQDLAEAYRYSRFANECWVAFPTEELGGATGKQDDLTTEARRLGVGLVTTNRKEKYFRTEERLPAQQMTPAEMDKRWYLHTALNVVLCKTCGVYFSADGEAGIAPKRPSELYGTVEQEENIARFKCHACRAK